MARRGKSKRLIKKTTTAQREAGKSFATPAIQTISKIVEILKPWELSSTNRFKTYQDLLQDDAVWSSIESRITSIEVSQSKPKLQYDKSSERSLWLKDFIQYNLSSMQKSTRQVGRDAAEMVYNGIAPFEIVTRVENSYDEYNGYFVLDNLVYIDPLTLDKTKPFVTESGGRKVKAWRQNLSAFMDTDGSLGKGLTLSGSVEIDARKIAVASYAASSSRPLGTSPLDAAYSYVKEKILIEEFLLMGIQKDLAGTPVLRVPSDLFDKAKDVTSPAYETMSQLIHHMENLHAGDQTFIILPSDVEQGTSTNLQYDINFKGVDGSGKNFDLVAIIEQKKKAIYTVLGAAHLIAGETGSGSMNLYEGKANQSAYYAQRDALLIDELYNEKVIPLILKLNGFTSEKITDIPRYVHNEIQPLSADEGGKFAQRVASVGMMPLVPETVNHFLGVIGVTYTVPEDATTEELREIMSNFDSNAGKDTGGTSGTGDSQAGGLGSSTNSENAS